MCQSYGLFTLFELPPPHLAEPQIYSGGEKAAERFSGSHLQLLALPHPPLLFSVSPSPPLQPHGLCPTPGLLASCL